MYDYDDNDDDNNDTDVDGEEIQHQQQYQATTNSSTVQQNQQWKALQMPCQCVKEACWCRWSTKWLRDTSMARGNK